MKKLVRPEAPECLNTLMAGRADWTLTNQQDKREIWAALNKMQNGFCAYCECKIAESDRKHIEHFKTCDTHPQLTFDWANLFGSCGDTSKTGGWLRCGIYKDNKTKGVGQYKPENLIKPDEEDPPYFLHFLTTGEVRPRSGLITDESFRATETIRVFNLNGDPTLLGRRKNAINAELQEIENFYKMKDYFLENEWSDLLQNELLRVQKGEFSTALTHAWSYNENK